MGTVVVHAGRPKAGSTSIQGFLAANAGELRGAGVDVVVPGPRRRDGRLDLVDVAPSDAGPAAANAGPLRARLRLATDVAQVRDDLVAGLVGRARRHDVVVLSGEALSVPVADGDPAFLGALQAVAQEHRVQLVCYLRPQHLDLEAQWRQAWRLVLPAEQRAPSGFVRHRSRRLHHDRTAALVAARAPDVELHLRPLVDPVVPGGDAVADLASRFLGAAAGRLVATGAGARRLNPGLPLDVVNALGVELPGRFAPSPVHDAEVRRLRRATWWRDLPPSPEADRSRRVLQRWCHAVHEPGNARLIAAHGWPLAHLVPPADDDAGPEEVDEELGNLDALWRPPPSDRTRALADRVLASADPTRAGDQDGS